MNLDKIIKYLKQYNETIKIMEVCGTHTSTIYKNGIRSLISDSITLVSGPGCPVCVTPPSVIDVLIALSQNAEILSFGDMFRVPGSKYSLAQGTKVRLMYSPLEVVALAKKQPSTNFVVAAVGFETTAPIFASLLETLIKENIQNVKLYTALKTVPEILDYVCTHEQIDAFICPGHVSAIIGSAPYRLLAEKYRKPFVISGFEAEHILAAIYGIISTQHEVKNLYPAVVRESGQTKALALLDKYFEKTDSFWRGIGKIPNSGYTIKKEYSHFSANTSGISEKDSLPDGCRCADVILGRILPTECALFGEICKPSSPIGPCMASSEGACGIYGGAL